MSAFDFADSLSDSSETNLGGAQKPFRRSP